jgi:hypothetical protein
MDSMGRGDESPMNLPQGPARKIFTKYLEEDRLLKNPHWMPRVSLAMPSNATKLVWVGS